MVGAAFSSTWLKIGRAEQHLSHLKQEIARWLETAPFSIDKQYEPETGRHSVSVRIAESIVFPTLSVIAGDCAHNLRCALDHMVYALAISAARTDPPPSAKHLQFPIVKTAGDFEKQRFRISSLTQRAQEFIERTQPYNSFHPELPPILSVLETFDNLDKHRLIHLTYAHNSGGSITFHKPRDWSIPAIKWRHEPLETGKEFLWFLTDPPQQLDYSCKVDFTVGVSHVPGPTGRTVSPLQAVMEGMMAQVMRIVGTDI
jgi:hypothetical protein